MSTVTSTSTPTSTLLVANRGEIARRIIRTARAMGIRTVAVFVDADARAPFVTDADEAVRLERGYLDGPAVVAAARRSGADAIHPGYGFLSENAGFARSVIDAGLVWVGPAPEVIVAMGDKINAKAAAVAAGVPTLPSTEDATQAGTVGYPLLVKASAGGGGKGMRIVERAEDLDEAVAAARREAKSSFGDDRVFLERYVARSRHVEIQILGDDHGTIVHLGERECSIQRRHQKVIEESPSPGIQQPTREAMGAAALALAEAIGYTSTGTVEFLVDDATGEFFFLEVNTRLQVEHPVTEEVTGVDLVREQLLVADGQPMSATARRAAEHLRSHRAETHAIEARLYAEDPAAGFLPATGTIEAFEPAAEPAVRWDSGVEVGSVVGVEFDPMLAKVTAHAPTRVEAALRLALALERLHLGGLTTNRDFLAAVLRTPEFLAGDTTTDFIERVRPRLAVEPDLAGLERMGPVAALWLQERNRRTAPVLAAMPSGWRNARLPAQTVGLRWGDHETTVRYRAQRDGTFAVGDDGRAVVHEWTPESIDIEVDGHRSTARITLDGDHLHLSIGSSTASLQLVPRFTVPGPAEVAGGFIAPMPGVVLDVRVAVGQAVTAGETLVVLEAMKMEHHMSAPADGTVAEVRVATGDQVANGAVLLVFEPTEATGEVAP
ncbi:acetyl/propionyl/methylcrotonyl-CoA carboxylase subunit alpha [Aquihabitans sp. McL0605]|uniref:acetyl/propionyl/methylcrotonyl-CoA carboxylase subunit alpha n=1 Tax=Aquihabitans sp. McL0605 TaxID=3415671 RepID=UPI003CEF311A